MKNFRRIKFIVLGILITAVLACLWIGESVHALRYPLEDPITFWVVVLGLLFVIISVIVELINKGKD